MWNGKRVSVIIPTYREKNSIYAAVQEVLATRVCDELIVVSNNAEPGTREAIVSTPARWVEEPRQGYGHALQRGYAEATGDLVLTLEPDGTFKGGDIIKLLAYAEDVDVVFGTRTSSAMIWSGANMGWFIRLGNFLVAKFMEFLFNTSILTDCGCTMKLLSRRAVDVLRPQFTVGGSHFSAELMLLAIVNGFRVIEVPVNYQDRVGESTITGSFRKTLVVGFRMIGLIVKFRLTRRISAAPSRPRRNPPV